MEGEKVKSNESVSAASVAVGDVLQLEMGAVAHGGACVARIGGAGGRVVFVRYALPGEVAMVRITEVRRKSFCRGEAIDILQADPQRITPLCAHFGPLRADGSGGCGGCDWQHTSPAFQRDLKARVVREQLQRLANLDIPVQVEALPGEQWAWRGRVRWALQRDGNGMSFAGPRRYRSHDVVPVNAAAPCLIAAPGLASEIAAGRPLTSADQVTAAVGSDAVVRLSYWRRDRLLPTSAAQPSMVEEAAGREFRVHPAGFWQAHIHAAETFCDVIADMLADHHLAGKTAWDLYGGVGLFAAPLAEAVGSDGAVVTVEQDAQASTLAGQNWADAPRVRAVCAASAEFMTSPGPSPAAVVLDPPRTGAGAAVCEALTQLRPRVVVYVACDPAALARDTATLLAGGYRLAQLRAFDAFPHTHHVECIAQFVPAEN